MRTLGVIALAIVIAGAAASWVPYNIAQDCPFDIRDACNKCRWDISWTQFVADGCNCTKFYQCHKSSSGVISWTQFECDKCMCFSNKLWTCSIKISDDDCPTNAPPTIVPIPTIRVYTNCFCVNFDGDAREHEYYKVDGSCGLPNIAPPVPIAGYLAAGRILDSSGSPCHVEIPYFQNNQFRTFSLCGMFNVRNVGNLPMGLVHNGWSNDCSPGSIAMYIDRNGIVHGKVNPEYYPAFDIPFGPAVVAGQWYKTCMIYNGRGDQRTLTLTLDSNIATTGLPFTKTIPKRGLVGLTELNHCNLRLGQFLDDYGVQHGFDGYLDTWCFSENLLRTNQCTTFGVEGPIQVE